MTPEQINTERMNARIKAVEMQRNNALADHAIAMGEIAVESQKNMELAGILGERDTRIAALEAELAELKKPKEA